MYKNESRLNEMKNKISALQDKMDNYFANAEIDDKSSLVFRIEIMSILNGLKADIEETDHVFNNLSGSSSFNGLSSSASKFLNALEELNPNVTELLSARAKNQNLAILSANNMTSHSIEALNSSLSNN